MKQAEFPYEGFKKGLRPLMNTPRNGDFCIECHNLAPNEVGLEAHEEIVDIATSYKWEGEGVYTPGAVTRSIVIRATDYVDSTTELFGVTVFLDGVSKGTTDVNGELALTGVAVGGHLLKLTKLGYTDSDADSIFNDFIFVI